MSAMADLSVDIGVRLDAVFEVRQASGDPMNLTGYSAKMQARTDGGALLLEASSGAGLTIDGPAGNITLGLTGNQTRGCYWDGKFDVLAWPGENTGEAIVVARGQVKVSKVVTRV